MEERGVKVFLDDKKTREVIVSLKELEDEREALEAEVNSLKEKVENLKKLQNEQNVDKSGLGKELDKLQEKIKQLEDKIGKLKEIISRLKAAGKDKYHLQIELLGYYENKKIHLMVGTIFKKTNPFYLLGIVFVHELMHAFFDMFQPKHPYCPHIEEPIAEYGMLCFMEMFEREYPMYSGILNNAKKHVAKKQHSLGVCHYGFGYYLFEDRKDFGTAAGTVGRFLCKTG